MSRCGVSLGLVRWNHSESSGRAAFILCAQQLSGAACICWVLTIFMISAIHQVAQEQNTLRLRQCGFKVACLIFTAPPPITFVLTCVTAVNISLACCSPREKRMETLLWFWLKVKPCGSTESFLEKASILQAFILGDWAIVDGI